MYKERVERAEKERADRERAEQARARDRHREGQKETQTSGSHAHQATSAPSGGSERDTQTRVPRPPSAPHTQTQTHTRTYPSATSALSFSTMATTPTALSADFPTPRQTQTQTHTSSHTHTPTQPQTHTSPTHTQPPQTHTPTQSSAVRQPSPLRSPLSPDSPTTHTQTHTASASPTHTTQTTATTQRDTRDTTPQIHLPPRAPVASSVPLSVSIPSLSAPLSDEARVVREAVLSEAHLAHLLTHVEDLLRDIDEKATQAQAVSLQRAQLQQQQQQQQHAGAGAGAIQLQQLQGLIPAQGLVANINGHVVAQGLVGVGIGLAGAQAQIQQQTPAQLLRERKEGKGDRDRDRDRESKEAKGELKQLAADGKTVINWVNSTKVLRKHDQAKSDDLVVTLLAPHLLNGLALKRTPSEPREHKPHITQPRQMLVYHVACQRWLNRTQLTLTDATRQFNYINVAQDLHLRKTHLRVLRDRLVKHLTLQREGKPNKVCLASLSVCVSLSSSHSLSFVRLFSTLTTRTSFAPTCCRCAIP